MTRIIFHLGTYKTGTSSIQNYLYENRAALLENGLLYPEFGVTKSGRLGRRHTPILHKFMGGGQVAIPQALLDEIKAADCELVVLSSEAWSAPGAFSHLNRAVAVLKAEGYESISAVLMLRNIAEYRVSHYREFCCNQNNTRPYKSYISSRHGVFDYLMLVRFFRALFGAGLSVLPFEAGKDSLQAFKEVVGSGFFEGADQTVPRANIKSVDALDVEILRCLSVAKQGKGQAEALRAAFGDGPWTERFTGDHEDFPDSYKADLAALSELDTQTVEALLADREIKGDPVSEMTAQIAARCTSQKSWWPWRK